MISITSHRSSADRPVFAALLVGFVLLGASCEKKAAPPRDAAISTYNQSRARGGARSASQISATASLGGGGGGVEFDYAPASVSVALAESAQPGAPDTRRIVRNGSLDLLVNDVAQSVEKIGSLVSAAGGFVEKSTQANSGSHSASVMVRVPAARLDQITSQIKGLATNVDRESVEVRDVTREYIDLDARLRNAQAEEAQYLQILKRATTIKDTLDVTEKLSDVRGRIEQSQGEMKFLTAQIDMSTLEISLRSEADAAVAGIHWRPLRQAKIAAIEMVSGLGDWVDSVVAFFINLPLIAVWFLSVVALIVVALRILRFLWQRFGPKRSWRLPWNRPAPPVSTPSQE
jgi:Domain of unknown function (DUF4349)